MIIWEYIAVIYNEYKERTERKYGLVAGDESTALAKIGSWYGDELIRIEYFGTPAEDPDDCLYELNDDYANIGSVTGRKFRKIIPELNKIPADNDKIYE